MPQELKTYRTAASFALGITLVMHLFFVIMFIFGREAFVPHDRPPHPGMSLNVDQLLASFVSNFIFTFILFILNLKLLKAELNTRYRIITIVGTSILCTVVISHILVQIQFLMFTPESESLRLRFIIGNLFRDLFIALIVVFVSQIVYLSHRKQQIALENEMLMAENVKTHFQALKNQMDPHFLFNTLNTLNSIIPVDPDKAQEYVHQLSAVFRYTLQKNEIVTLEEELKFTRDYCSLMQIRYGDSLMFHFDIHKNYCNYMIIPLGLQTLVENAIKHNIISNRQPLQIAITTSPNDTVTVSNPLQQKKEAESGEGIGLANLSERYRLKWQKEIEVRNVNNSFEVSLPLISPQA